MSTGSNAEIAQRNRLNYLGGVILDASIEVHRELGPGLLESAYVTALIKELTLRNLHVRSKVPIEMSYKKEPLGKVYVMDLLVEEEIVVEIKSVIAIEPIFKAQLITYLKLAKKKLGYLINFNETLLKQGFNRIVYNF